MKHNDRVRTYALAAQDRVFTGYVFVEKNSQRICLALGGDRTAMIDLLGRDAVGLSHIAMTIDLDPDPESGAWREVKTGTLFAIETIPKPFMRFYSGDDTDGSPWVRFYAPEMQERLPTFMDMLRHRAANAKLLQSEFLRLRKQPSAS